MADARAITLSELRTIITDADELTKGTKIVDTGGLAHLARFEHKLYADAAGSQVYKVQVLFEDKGVRGRCSCMAARSRPFCKHAAALLVAWSRKPDGFAVADVAPAGVSDGKKKAVKQGKVDTGALMAQGVAQVTTVVRELAVTGIATVADDRAAQIRALGENLREHKLRRLSARTIALADQIAAARTSGARFDEPGYAELLGELLLTARKLDKHLAGEPLDDRHVEELVGKTWTKKDRTPIAGLRLLEVGFLTRETVDDFVIRESRLVDVATGVHYTDKQILPRFLAKRTPPKPSYAGLVLADAGGSLYPSYPPRRIDLDPPRTAPLAGDDVDALAATALPTVAAAIAALQDHAKDVFAPPTVPLTVTCDMVIADRGRLQLVDPSGAAMFLPDDDELGDLLATALAGVRLRAIVGDASFDGALPTVAPLAVVCDGPRGRELRPIASRDPARDARKVKVVAAAAAGRSNWASTARAMGMSTAAIALGEVREELASVLFAGLATATLRRVEPLAIRLRELTLTKQADALIQLASRPDPADRLDDFIKLHQVLGIALARLAGAALVDRAGLEASPVYASVFVRTVDAVMTPDDIAGQLGRGELNRFEAATRYARYYQSLPAETLIDQIYPSWADGSASPYVALAARAHPDRAVARAAAVIAAGSLRATRQRRPPPRMATLTALRVLESIGDHAAELALREAADAHADLTVRALADAARGRLGAVAPPDQARRVSARDQLLNAPHKEQRAAAAATLANLGDVDAIPLLRLSWAGDISGDVRDAAGLALGRLGDAESVDPFIATLARQGSHAQAATAAVALGHLGDVRGIRALLDAWAAAWRPDVVATALAAVGPAATPELIRYVTDRPNLLKRSTARPVWAAITDDELRAALVERLDELIAASAHRLVTDGGALFEITRDRPAIAEALAQHLIAACPELAAPKASREAKALWRKATAHRKPAKA